MGLLSSIKEAANPEVAALFNRLYYNYYDAANFFYKYATLDSGFKWIGILTLYDLVTAKPELYTPHHPFLTKDIDYDEKKYIVDHKDEIIELHKIIRQNKQKAEIVEFAKKYPHAFLYFCIENDVSPASIYKDRNDVSMPGKIKFTSFNIVGKIRNRLRFWPDYDKNFEELIKKELGIFAPPKTISELFKSRSFSPIGYHYPPISNNNGHFEEDKNVAAIYPLLPSFEAKEKELEALLIRERLWKDFESHIIFSPLASKYYKSFFFARYGTEDPPLSAYESIAKDRTPLDEYIAQKEAPYRKMRGEFPDGVAQFENDFPNVPHTNYLIFQDKIRELQRQSIHVKYPQRLNTLSSAIASAFKGIKVWTVEQIEISCKYETYEKVPLNGICPMMYVYHKNIFKEALDGDDKERIRSYYPHCSDIIENASLLKNIKSADLLNLLSSVLDPVIAEYVKVFGHICIVMDDEIERILSDTTSADSRRTLLLRLIRNHTYSTNTLGVESLTYFEKTRLNNFPYLFLKFQSTHEHVSQQLSTMAKGFYVAALLSVFNTINEEELADIEECRKDEEDKKKLSVINALRRECPFGFESFSREHSLPPSEYLEHYSLIQSSADQIRRIQQYEDRRKKENETIRQAQRIISLYPDCARENGYSHGPSLSYMSALEIISKESKWKDIEQIYYKRFELFNVNKAVDSMPHKYFFDYYPKNRYSDSQLSCEQISNRQFVWSFKDGPQPSQIKAACMVSDFINNSLLKSYSSKLVLVCCPASNKVSNSTRFKFFSEEVCNRTGLSNGFAYIHITGETTPRNRGGDGCVAFDAEKSFFSGRFVILFDDIVTSGMTISVTRRRIELVGAKVVGVISLGQTVSD